MLRPILILLALTLAPAWSEDPRKQVVANFAGSLKRVTRKEVVIEPEPANEMSFVRTRRTRFLSGTRQVDGASLPAGITVQVDAFERLNRELEAVTVHVTLPDQIPPK